MKRCFRLTKNFEYMNVYRAGKRWSGPFFTMYIKKNSLDYTRLGVSISKKVGKSVVRNRLKRILKEIIRKNMDRIKKGYDIVISAKPEMAGINYHQAEEEIISFLKRGNIWNDKENNHKRDTFL